MNYTHAEFEVKERGEPKSMLIEKIVKLSNEGFESGPSEPPRMLEQFIIAKSGKGFIGKHKMDTFPKTDFITHKNVEHSVLNKYRDALIIMREYRYDFQPRQ